MSTPQDHGRSYEKRLAKKLGDRTVPGSGNRWGSKGDVRRMDHTARFYIQAKSTDTLTYSFKLEDWLDEEHNALMHSLDLAFCVHFWGTSVECAIVYKDLLLHLFEGDDFEFITDLIVPRKGAQSVSFTKGQIETIRYSSDSHVAASFILGDNDFAVVHMKEFQEIKSFYEQLER